MLKAYCDRCGKRMKVDRHLTSYWNDFYSFCVKCNNAHKRLLKKFKKEETIQMEKWLEKGKQKVKK